MNVDPIETDLEFVDDDATRWTRHLGSRFVAQPGLLLSGGDVSSKEKFGGFVYFVRSAAIQGPVKIGCTRTPLLQRLASLQTGNAHRLSVEAAVQVKSDQRCYELEQHLIFLFRAHRVLGEWFDLDIKAVAQIVADLHEGAKSPLQPDEMDEWKRLKATHIRSSAAEQTKNFTEEVIFNVFDITDEAELIALQVGASSRNIGTRNKQRLEQARWKQAYKIPLSDTVKWRAISDFSTRFGVAKRREQFVRLCQEQRGDNPPSIASVSAPPPPALASDPLGYQLEESHAREHLEHVLTSVGFVATALRAPTGLNGLVNVDEQVAKLASDTPYRRAIIKKWEERPHSHSAWWKMCKSTNDWTVVKPQRGGNNGDDGDGIDEKKNEEEKEADELAGELVCKSSQQMVDADVLFQALLRGCRQYVKSRFGIKIGTGRMARARKGAGEVRREVIHQIDATYWNEVSVLGLKREPQVIDPRILAGRRLTAVEKRREAHTAAVAASVASAKKRAKDGVREQIRLAADSLFSCNLPSSLSATDRKNKKRKKEEKKEKEKEEEKEREEEQDKEVKEKHELAVAAAATALQKENQRAIWRRAANKRRQKEKKERQRVMVAVVPVPVAPNERGEGEGKGEREEQQMED